MSNRITCVLALSLSLTAATAAQQEDDPAPTDQANMLRGPEVGERDVPGVTGPFSRSMDERQMRDRAVPPRVFLEAIRSLEGGATPESLVTTPQQRTQIATIAREYRSVADRFMEEHGIRDLRRRSRDDQQSRRELRELMREMPSPEPYFVRIWSLLDEQQRALVESRIERAMERMRDERFDRAMRKRRPEGGEPRAMQEMASDEQRLERIVARIEALPPRARSRLIARIEDGLERIESELVREPRPAPSIDDVEIPPPEARDQRVPG